MFKSFPFRPTRDNRRTEPHGADGAASHKAAFFRVPPHLTEWHAASSLRKPIESDISRQLQGTGPELSRRDAALIERARTVLRQHLSDTHPRRTRPADFERYLHLHIADQRRERFVVLFLGPHDELIGEDVMFSGDATQVPVFIPEIIRAASERRADGVIVAHNHPSGPATPSEADRNLVVLIRQALAAAGLRYVDDVIVSRTETYSHRRAGTM